VEELETRTVPSAAHPLASVVPATFLPPYNPQDITYAYNFQRIMFRDSQGHKIVGDGTGQTIAIVDAFDNPNIQNDLNFFDTKWGLPATTITKLDQTGNPVNGQVPGDHGWGLEIALDVEWTHALAPKANIVLFEATSNSYSDLLTAETTAAGYAGVGVVSNSWGSGEFSGENGFDSTFTTPDNHVTFVYSSGDSGAPPIYPSVSPNVLAVGGTSLSIKTNRRTGLPAYGGESGWSGSGGGPSSFETEPSWQQGVQQSGSRTSPDVAFDADPRTGVYVYDTYGFGGGLQVGGTSFSAPAWAALLAIVNQGRALQGKGTLGNAQIAVYSLPATDFHDITTGNNGYPAHAGYDYVTGLGTPKANLIARDLAAAANPTVAKTVTSSAKPNGNKTVNSFVAEALSRISTTTTTVVTTTQTPAPTTLSFAALAPQGAVTVGGTVAVISESASFKGVSTQLDDVMTVIPAGDTPAAPASLPPAPVVVPRVIPPQAPEAPVPPESRDAWFMEEGSSPVVLRSEISSESSEAGDDSSTISPLALAGLAAFAAGSWRRQISETEERQTLRL
jgi:subtilase family serine protease